MNIQKHMKESRSLNILSKGLQPDLGFVLAMNEICHFYLLLVDKSLLKPESQDSSVKILNFLNSIHTSWEKTWKCYRIHLPLKGKIVTIKRKWKKNMRKRYLSKGIYLRNLLLFLFCSSLTFTAGHCLEDLPAITHCGKWPPTPL